MDYSASCLRYLAPDAELNVHTLDRGATFAHTVEKMPELVEKSMEKLLEAWAAGTEKQGVNQHWSTVRFFAADVSAERSY